MLYKIRNTIGGLAAILGIAAFSVYYFYKREYNISLDDLYFITTFIIFSIFSGVLFSTYRKQIVGSIYLLSFIFFTSCTIATIIEYINRDIIVMAHIYICLIITFVLTILTYLYLWIRHLLS